MDGELFGGRSGEKRRENGWKFVNTVRRSWPVSVYVKGINQLD
jgi:hypothetical protein